MSRSVTVATINVQHGNTPAEILEDLNKAIDAGASVLLCQEFGQSSDREKLKDLPSGWKAPLASGASKSDPVAWNSSVWQKVDFESVHINDTTAVNAGAGGTSIPARALAATLLKHIETGIKVRFASVHLCPSSNNDRVPRNTARGDLLKLQINRVAAYIKKCQDRGEIFILGGDMNVSYPPDAARRHPAMPYHSFGMDLHCWPTYRTVNVPDGGTHGNRLIDWICCTHTDSIRAVSHRTLPIHSDHDTMLATFQIGSGLPEPDPVPDDDPEGTDDGPDTDDPDGSDDGSDTPPTPYFPPPPPPGSAPSPIDTTFPEYCR